MTIVFETKSKEQNRFVINNSPFGKIYFMKGAYTTTDKGIVEFLLSHPLYRQGEYKLVTNEEVVDKYLAGETPDKLTKEILDDITIEGIRELGKLLNAKSDKPNLIKAEIKGQPISSEVQTLIDFYSTRENVPFPEPKTEVEEEAVEEDTVEETKPKRKQSTDFTAREAIDYISMSTPDELEDFIGEEEDRKTVLSAYEEKIS